MKRAIRSLAIGLLASFILGLIAIAAFGLRDQVIDADLAVIPGNTVNPDGTPSKRLAGRLDAALDLYRRGRCKVLLVSGGIGSEGFDEAAVMKAYLVAHGVPATAVVTDNHGTNTFETARFAASLMHAQGYRSAILVSQYFHLARFSIAMHKHGVAAAGHVYARYFEARDIYSLSREFFGVIDYAFKPSQAPAA